MKKLFSTITALALALSLAACGSSTDNDTASDADHALTIAATTYPIYLFTTAVVGDTEGVNVEQIITDKVSCVHDYTLTTTNMKMIENADIIVENGAGFEDFMSDAFSASSADIIDSSEGIELMSLTEDGVEEDDPHIWMSPANAEIMINNIAAGLGALDSANAEVYTANAELAVDTLRKQLIVDGDYLSAPQVCYLINFHDGFQYFASYFGLPILASIEEEEGSEASAKDIQNIISLIGEYNIPAIYTETNGSDATAQAIARETGVQVFPLDLIMYGEGEGIEPYIYAINQNYYTIRDAFSSSAD